MSTPGRLVWNRQRYVKDPETGKRLARPNPPERWIVEEVPHLRIVDADLWDAVRRRQAEILATPAVQKIMESKFWTRRRARHLLTGLVFCGVCGARFTSVGRDYLGCGRARNSGNCHNRRSIRRGRLESLILDALKSRLMRPDLVKEFVAEFHREINRLNRDSEQGRGSRVKEMKTVSRKLDGLIEAIADGLRTPGLKARLIELEQRKQILEEELAHAPAPAPRLHPGLAEVYRRKVENLPRGPGRSPGPATRRSASCAVSSSVSSCTRSKMASRSNSPAISPAWWRCRLTRPTPKKAVFDEKTACSVKMVAGVRYQRYLQISEGWLPRVS